MAEQGALVESEKTATQPGGRKRREVALGKIVAICFVVIFLLVIVVPGYLEPPWASKLARATSDMRSIATALEAYHADHRAYPPMVPLRNFGGRDAQLRKAGGWDLMTIGPGDGIRQGLTTPVAYIERLPVDGLSPEGTYPYVYRTDGGGWILLSPCHDGDYDLDPGRDYTSSETQPTAHLLTHGTYDVTNGTISDGDVWRVKR